MLVHRAIAVADTSRSLGPASSGLLSGQSLLTVATMEQKVAAQIAGLGVGYLPEAFARPHLVAGRLVAKTVAEPKPPARLRYAWRTADRGKALAWWLDRLSVARVRERLLDGPASVPAIVPPGAPGSAAAGADASASTSLTAAGALAPRPSPAATPPLRKAAARRPR